MPGLNPWEYRSMYNQMRIDATEAMVEGHRFGYTKRRRRGDHQWAGFKAFCSCKWRSKKWFPNVRMASDEHSRHAYAFEANNQRLF